MKMHHVICLSAVLLLYLCVGAVIFRATEWKKENDDREFLLHLFDNFTVRCRNCTTRRELSQLLNTIAEAGLSLDYRATAPQWDFAGAFSFAVTIVTTIGYGHVYPRSNLGRSLCVVYAIIGIPLTMIVIGGIGERMSKIAQKLTRSEICSRKPLANRFLSVSILFGSGWILIFLLPSILFHYLEGWSILEGLYYSFITLSTIGLGDYVAGRSLMIHSNTTRSVYRIVVYLWILIGLAYISLIIRFICKLLGKAGEVPKKANERLGARRLQISGKKPDDSSRKGQTERSAGSADAVYIIPDAGADSYHPECVQSHRKLRHTFSLDAWKKQVHLMRISARRSSN